MELYVPDWKNGILGDVAFQMNSFDIIDMVLQHGNDTDLGEAVRKYVDDIKFEIEIINVDNSEEEELC